jgi:hypothetical protein
MSKKYIFLLLSFVCSCVQVPDSNRKKSASIGIPDSKKESISTYSSDNSSNNIYSEKERRTSSIIGDDDEELAYYRIAILEPGFRPLLTGMAYHCYPCIGKATIFYVKHLKQLISCFNIFYNHRRTISCDKLTKYKFFIDVALPPVLPFGPIFSIYLKLNTNYVKFLRKNEVTGFLKDHPNTVQMHEEKAKSCKC